MQQTLWGEKRPNRRRRKKTIPRSATPPYAITENDCEFFGHTINVWDLAGCTTNNVSKAKIYQIETVPGNAGNPPVKLTFQDMNADGKPDMLVQIGDDSALIYVTLFNKGSAFVSKL